MQLAMWQPSPFAVLLSNDVRLDFLSPWADQPRPSRFTSLTANGIGPITASVLMTELGDAQQFGSARQFAASVGLVPRQYSTGGTPKLLGISKRGDKNLRRLLVQGARAIMQRVERRTDRLGVWVRELLAR